jgi:hypothetical protein
MFVIGNEKTFGGMKPFSGWEVASGEAFTSRKLSCLCGDKSTEPGTAYKQSMGRTQGGHTQGSSLASCLKRPIRLDKATHEKLLGSTRSADLKRIAQDALRTRIRLQHSKVWSSQFLQGARSQHSQPASASIRSFMSKKTSHTAL